MLELEVVEDFELGRRQALRLPLLIQSRLGTRRGRGETAARTQRLRNPLIKEYT